MTRLAALLGTATVVSGLTIGGYLVVFSPSGHQCSASVAAGGKAAIGGPFELVDHTGVTVTDQDVIQDLTLIYFGYTYCPDVCPLDTVRNLEAVDLLAEDGIDVKPVFITIDPARDTSEALADYVDVMHPKMVGLTGSDEQISAASRAYKTFYQKNGDDEDYLMDHSTFTYLMAPGEGLLEFFRRDSTPEDMAETIGCFSASI